MAASRPSLKSSWQRLLHAAGEQIALLGAAEQTRLSWARPVRSVDQIPEAYRPYLQAHLPALEACLPAVLTPTFRGFLRQENEKLVFAHAERLYILEHTPAGLSPTVFPFAGIHTVEVGVILLKAWVRVSGLSDGGLKSAALKHNSVTQYLFDPLVAQIRDAQSDSPGLADLRAEQARFAPLQALSFKFMNYARRSLQPGQRVIAYTLQPELRLPRLTLLGHPLAMRRLDLAHLCILTDSELIVIRDDPGSPQGCDDTHYGGIWDYLPLSQVRRAGLEQRSAGPALVLSLPGDDRFEVLFSEASREQVERLCTQIESRLAECS